MRYALIHLILSHLIMFEFSTHKMSPGWSSPLPLFPLDLMSKQSFPPFVSGWLQQQQCNPQSHHFSPGAKSFRFYSFSSEDSD